MYYTGIPFEVSMRYHGFSKELVLRLYPLREGCEIYLEKEPKYINGVAASLDGVKAEVSASVYLEEEI